jgi:hypothetical protein
MSAMVVRMIMNTNSPMKNRICFWCGEGMRGRRWLFRPNIKLSCSSRAASASQIYGRQPNSHVNTGATATPGR